MNFLFFDLHLKNLRLQMIVGNILQKYNETVSMQLIVKKTCFSQCFELIIYLACMPLI